MGFFVAQGVKIYLYIYVYILTVNVGRWRVVVLLPVWAAGDRPCPSPFLTGNTLLACLLSHVKSPAGFPAAIAEFPPGFTGNVRSFGSGARGRCGANRGWWFFLLKSICPGLFQPMVLIFRGFLPCHHSVEIRQSQDAFQDEART